MYWDDEVYLLAKPDLAQDAEGNIVPGEPERRHRLCNSFTVGAQTWASAVDLGLRADAEIQLWAFEYDGEDEVEYHGVEYDVVRATRQGDYVRLQLGRRASNG